jgi:bifunctional non-homologous end joining protein LigD
MIEYYRSIADVIVPHLARRPVTLWRFPEGVEGPSWYQTNCRGAPEWVRVVEVPGRRGALFRMCVVDDLRSLLWVANLGTIELHPFLARVERPDEPTALVFDLDPGPPADVVDCCRVALRLRELLGDREVFPKTSGSVGLHLYVPVEGATYAETKALAREGALRLAAERPDEVVAASARPLREGKVLVDWLQNDPSRSTVAPYSLRGTGWPTVSTPVTWEEVERVSTTGRPELLTLDWSDALERVERLGDLFAPLA